MTNDFKPIGFKKIPFIPKTETRIFLGGRPIDQQTEPTNSKSVSKQPYQSERVGEINPGYGPCSYSGCPWPASVSCKVEINIEGINRKWARKSWNGAWLPGYWEEGNFDSNQLSRRSLIVNDVDQSRRVLPLLSNDSVYTINFWGKHCAEDARFCNVSMDIIRKAVSHHESGYEVNEEIMLDSDVSKWSRYAFKVVGNLAVDAVGAVTLGPAYVGAKVWTGAVAWTASKVAQECCESESAKETWRSVGNFGGDAFKGALGGQFAGLAGGRLAEAAGKSFEAGWECVDKLNNFKDFVGKPSYQILKHKDHLSSGISYDYSCEICNS